MASQSIEIKNLYKIFGPHGEKYVDMVKNGLSKTDLNDQYDHVLGLQDINIHMPAGEIQVVMGLSVTDRMAWMNASVRASVDVASTTTTPSSPTTKPVLLMNQVPSGWT